MSYRHDLLRSEAPLEKWERDDLKQWLVVLTDDCITFGATPEDEATMRLIRKRLAELEPTHD